MQEVVGSTPIFSTKALLFGEAFFMLVMEVYLTNVFSWIERPARRGKVVPIQLLSLKLPRRQITGPEQGS
jgi:hypothetical protein